MIYQKIELGLDYEKLGIAHDGYSPRLDCYLPDRRGQNAGRAVLILPGGGYAMTSDREGEPVALEYAARGLAAFVLWYSVVPNRFPASLLETGESVRLIRQNAKAWGVNPKELYVCGFSAGGNLAAAFILHCRDALIRESLGEADYSVAGGILAYPVITDDVRYRHESSFENLLGERKEELSPYFSAEKHVGSDTPRMFLWHTAADSGVPVMNSLLLAEALARNQVPFELHVYETKEHGLSLANDLVGYGPETEGLRHRDWLKDSVQWMQRK